MEDKRNWKARGQVDGAIRHPWFGKERVFGFCNYFYGCLNFESKEGCRLVKNEVGCGELGVMLRR